MSAGPWAGSFGVSVRGLRWAGGGGARFPDRTASRSASFRNMDELHEIERTLASRGLRLVTHQPPGAPESVWSAIAMPGTPVGEVNRRSPHGARHTW